MIIEAIQCKLNSFLSSVMRYSCPKRWYPKICCNDPHDIVVLFWITSMSYGSTNNLKAMKTPHMVPVVLKHINKVFRRP